MGHWSNIKDSSTEIMRITKTGIWVNPDVDVTDTAKAVLDALDGYIKKLVNEVVHQEREACAKLVEADGLARGADGYMLIKAASRIRARGDASDISQKCVDKTAKDEHEPDDIYDVWKDRT